MNPDTDIGGRRARAALAAIVLLGAALRFFPIWFGLPYIQARPDEGTVLGHAAAIMAGDLNPHFFNWPSLTFYLLAVVLKLGSIVSGPLTPTASFIVARAVIAVAGTLTIVVLAQLARRTAGRRAAALAAFFLAIAVLHVRDSHFAMTDVLMTLLVTASLGMLIKALDRHSLGDVALAGLLGGLAISTKYSAAAIVAAMLAVQVLWRGRPRDVRPSLLFSAALIAGFLAATPFAVLDARTFAADVLFESRHLSSGHNVLLGRGWAYHLTHALPHGLGFALFGAAAVGAIPLARHYHRPAIVIGAFAGAFFAAIGSGQTVFFRYVMPLVPIACLAAAVAVSHVGRWLAARWKLPESAAVCLLGAMVGAPSLVTSLRMDLLLARTDTRVLAARWLTPRLRPTDTLYDSGGDYARLDYGATPYHDWRFDPATRSFGDPEGRTPDWMVIANSPLFTYTAVDAEVWRLIDRAYVLAYEVRAARGGTGSGVYDLQDAFFMPFSRLDTVERPGPDVRIYRRR